MRGYWITTRTGGVYGIEYGREEEVLARIAGLNETDEQGSTSVLSGPFNRADAQDEFDRLNK